MSELRWWRKCGVVSIKHALLPGIAEVEVTTATPKWSQLVMIENNVVSYPPCWVTVEVKAPSTLRLSVRRPQPAGGIEEQRHVARRPAKARRCADDDLCPQCRSAFAVAGEVRKEAYAVTRPHCASNLIGVSRLAFPEQLIEIVFKAVLPAA